VALEFLKNTRRRYPPEFQLYIVMDGLSAHWTRDIRDWARTNHVGLLPTPTNASHLNRIECHFWAYVEFIINGSDYDDWIEFSKATQAYIRRHNRDRHDPVIRELENRRKVA
jgi:transposase